jgi:5-hydroxyisourate hydrolase
MSGKLTTHVLDTASGKPAAGVRIQLHRLEGTTRTFLSEATTTPDGRTGSPLLAGENFTSGTYELTFHLGPYFGETAFLDTVPIRFRIADPAAHYHVPLLCSPWSYSTYRGS